uniref:ATP synthase complex subunit 8 n=1 Tax=Nephaspis sp. DPP-2018 TaxID=2136114 RepID=A0A343YVM0_9CUCU|nr:ATP synthase F0 subunit 8 [Nephaspis sp. DPP-2018]
MPQMMPLNWLSLTIFFLMIFLLVNMMNYYNFFNKPMFLSSNKILKNYNWKW